MVKLFMKQAHEPMRAGIQVHGIAFQSQNGDPDTMNLSQRSKLSLCQFLALFGRDELIFLLGKHGLPTDELENERRGQTVPTSLRRSVLRAADSQLGDLIQELARTQNSMRTSISPRYRFDERWADLRLCLELDGYGKGRNEFGGESDHFVPIEPVIEGVEPIEDDLTRELQRSGLVRVDEILRVLDNSANAFRSGDVNGCLNNARVALQTLATSIAQLHLSKQPGSFDPAKWGQVIAYLRTSGFITQQQEQGLAGVFSFVSPGSHIPVGFTEQGFARLGRSLVVSFCYFLTKRLNAGES